MARKEMTSQQRIRTTISLKEPDRVPIHDSPWGATVNRWRKEGMPDNISPEDFFGYEIVAIGADLSPRFPIKVVAENEEYITETTPEGGLRRNHRDYSTTPEIIDTPIKKKDDWLPIKERLKPDIKRIDWASSWRTYQRARDRGRYIIFAAPGGYDLLQCYIDSERLLIFMAEDPSFVKEMVDAISDLLLETVMMMYSEGFEFDGVWFFNDMGYRNGLLFSPRMYETIIGPSDRQRNTWIHEHGMQTILHSCGLVKELIPQLIAHGFDCLHPLEVKAGMDVRKLKVEYGSRIAFFGGIDVRLMADPDDSKIVEEIREKFKVAKDGGGYIYHSDHSVPLDVSFKKYQFVMDCVRRYALYD